MAKKSSGFGVHDGLSSSPHHAGLDRLARRGLALAASSAMLLVAGVADAGAIGAPITWQTAQTISGDSDVNTGGSLVYAYNLGTSGVVSDTTVGGVTFAAAGVSSSGSASFNNGNLIIQSSPSIYSQSNFGGSGAPYTSLGSSYQSLLGGGVYSTSSTYGFFVLTGLTAGRTYSVQLWSSNSSGVSGTGAGDEGLDLSSSLISDAYGGNTSTLNSITAGIGQYVTGTFTAVSGQTVQVIDIQPSGGTAWLVNALQLRDITATGVPGGAGLASVIGLGAATGRRRRR